MNNTKNEMEKLLKRFELNQNSLTKDEEGLLRLHSLSEPDFKKRLLKIIKK